MRSLALQNKEFQTQQAKAAATDLFNKNQACQKYMDEINQTLKTNSNNPFALDIENFDTLFYSPKDHTCLYTYDSITTSGDDAGKREYFVYNALTGAFAKCVVLSP